MRFRLVCFSLAVALLLLVPHRSTAWGFDVHRFITDKAIDLLPDGMKPFYQHYRAFIVEHTIDPDLWRTAGWDDEPPRHFLDLDAYGAPPFDGLPRDFDRAIQQWGRDVIVKNGMLPWRTSEIFGLLQRSFAQQRQGGTTYALENVKFYSAIIAHYVEDGHVPLHAVMNYDGQLTGQRGVHSRWESDLVVRVMPQLHLTPAAPVPVTDPRSFMFDTLQASYPGAAVILKADALAIEGRDAYDDEYFKVLDRETRPLLEQQLSKAISAVASMLQSAWDAGGRPDLPVDAPKPVQKVQRSK